MELRPETWPLPHFDWTLLNNYHIVTSLTANPFLAANLAYSVSITTIEKV